MAGNGKDTKWIYVNRGNIDLNRKDDGDRPVITYRRTADPEGRNCNGIKILDKDGNVVAELIHGVCPVMQSVSVYIKTDCDIEIEH